MTLAVGDILKVVATLVYPADGGINQNVFAVEIVGAGGPFDDQDVLDDMEDWLDNMYANLTTFLTDNIQGASVTVYVFDTVGLDFDEVGLNAWGFAPTQALEYLPRAVSALVLGRTTDPDKLGKKYIPGISEAHNSDGLFIATLVVAMLAYAADWVTPFVGAASGASFQPGVWSPTDLAIYHLIDTIVANLIPAYQRRRKRNVGI